MQPAGATRRRMSDNARARLQAILTRAAVVEVQRQKAARERDTVACGARQAGFLRRAASCRPSVS